MNKILDSETVVVGSFSITKPLPNNSQMVIQGHLYNKDELIDIHNRLDMYQDAAQRQHLRASVEFLEAERKKHVENLELIRNQYEALVNIKETGKQLKTDQKNKYEQGQATIDAALRGIEKLDKQISETKTKVSLDVV